jgi:uncharacterized short protein YbdD (DUF466 family)
VFKDLARMGKYLGQTARLMVGLPDYDAYVQHTRTVHPDRTPMTYEEFFRERQAARFEGNRNGKCC